MKNMIRISFILAVIVLLSGCHGIEVKSNIGSSPLFHYGERVLVLNSLKYNIEIVYRTWGAEHVKLRLSPGQDGVVTGLRSKEYLIAKVCSNEGDVIGTATFHISDRKNPQMWEVYRYNRLR
jgi:hypothetical protein